MLHDFTEVMHTLMIVIVKDVTQRTHNPSLSSLSFLLVSYLFGTTQISSSKF